MLVSSLVEIFMWLIFLIEESDKSCRRIKGKVKIHRIKEKINE